MKKHFHFIGIGGVGMGAIALLMAAKGYKISGSDLKESQLTVRLKEQGADIFIGHSAHNVGACDFVVYSSAISADNPELLAAKENNIPLLKRAQMLAELMKDQKSITIAGAHGKTTTTSMIANLLIKAGLNPTTAVGGIIGTTDGPAATHNASLGDGKYFVAEVDESDGSFLFFAPHLSVITNIDFEHVDYYHSWENILGAYRAFIERTQKNGCLVACGDDEKLSRLLSSSSRQYLTYGFSPANDLTAKNLSYSGYVSHFECSFKNKDLGTFELKVPGRHNILNALACIGAGLKLSIDLDVIRASLKEFTGVQRRFQLKAHINDIMLIDDYGHHPTEIMATIAAAKSFGRKRVIVVFQPHRYTRTKFLMKEFTSVLSTSDYLIVTDIYAASEEAIDGVNAQKLLEMIKEVKQSDVIYKHKDDILAHLLDIVVPGDMVLTIGAGDIGRISENFAKKLKETQKELV